MSNLSECVRHQEREVGMVNYYKCRYYFNASHCVKKGEAKVHPHTFTVTLYLKPENKESFISFEEMDGKIQKVLEQFKGRNLNEMSVFFGEEPTIERIAKILNQELELEVKKIGFRLLKMELNETPLRGYILINSTLSKNTGKSEDMHRDRIGEINETK